MLNYFKALFVKDVDVLLGELSKLVAALRNEEKRLLAEAEGLASQLVRTNTLAEKAKKAAANIEALFI